MKRGVLQVRSCVEVLFREVLLVEVLAPDAAAVAEVFSIAEEGRFILKDLRACL